MYTVNEIKEAIEEDFESDWSEFLDLTEDEGGVLVESLGQHATHVDEGGESRPWVIFQIGEQYFEINGTHDSWEGTEWDGGLQEVEPFKKTITAFRPKND